MSGSVQGVGRIDAGRGRSATKNGQGALVSRILELVDAVRRKYPSDAFFRDFEASCRRHPDKRRAYRTYDDALRFLDERSWAILRAKAMAHFRDHRTGNLKQGFFNQLNESFAYRHLVCSGATTVELLPERATPTPDIGYSVQGLRMHCEVKTLSISDEEIGRRGSGQAFVNAYVELSEGFLNKLLSTVRAARRQIASQGTAGLTYLVVEFDDIALDCYQHYRRQLASFARGHGITDVHVKWGLRGRRRMSLVAHRPSAG